MKSSTKDKIKGRFKEAMGKAKEKTGKATGNKDLQDRGTIEKTGGKVQRKVVTSKRCSRSSNAVRTVLRRENLAQNEGGRSLPKKPLTSYLPE